MKEIETHLVAVKGFIISWLVCGPFPKIGPHPSGRDAFYTDFVKDAGGEEHIEPKIGLSHTSSCVESGNVQWMEHVADPNGFVDLVKLFGEPFAEFWNLRGGIAYAYTSIQCEGHSRAVFLLGSEDSAMVWLNGRLIHHNHIGRSPSPGQDIFVADLEPGVNRLLVKVARYAGGWGFYLQRFDAMGSLFVNEAGAFIPHFKVGEKLKGWACIPVVNTANQKLNKVCLEVLENSLFTQGRAEITGLAPGEWRKIPFWIATKREVRPDEDAELRISVEVDGDVTSVSIKPEVRRNDEWFMTNYRSKVDGSVQPYGLLIPTSYNKSHSYPLIVLLHGYKGGWAIEGYALKEWCIVAGVYARGEVPYREIGERDVFEVITAVKERYNIDEDRIYLKGHSMGGGGTWYLGLHRPDVWAAVVPLAARADYRLGLERLRVEGEVFPEYFWALMDEVSPMYLAENALNLPIFVSHGSEDKVVDVDHSRRIVAMLREMNYMVEYDEKPGVGHTWNVSGRPWWGEEWVDRPVLSNFFHRNRRKRYPKKVHYKTNTLRFNKAYWVEIIEMSVVYETAQITAEILEGNMIQVRTENVLQYALKLHENLGLDMDKPIIVVTNGFEARVEPKHESGKVILRAVPNERGESTKYMVLLNFEEAEKKTEFSVWAMLDQKGVAETFHTALGEYDLRKKPNLFGPIIDAFNNPFILVYGTQGSELEVEANTRTAHDVATWWKSYANGDCEVKADREVTVQEILSYNLVLFGNPKTNVLTARLKDGLPIRFEEETIRLGLKTFAGEDVGFIMVYPNPLNPERYVLLNASITARGMKSIKKLYTRWVTLPDYIVFNSTIAEEGWKAYLAAGFFDKYWQLMK